MAMIWLSEKRDVFTQNFLDPIRRKFYLWRALFSGGDYRATVVAILIDSESFGNEASS
jgi:hypothetical protein